MSKIVKTPLGEILQFQRGYDLPSSKRTDGDYPVISSAGFSGTHTAYKVDGENVVTGRYGTIGEIYYYNGKCWPLNTSLYVKDFKGNLPLYVYYLLQYALKVDGKDKSTVPGVDRNVLHMMKIPFFSNTLYQSTVIESLKAIDAKITLNKRINAELEAMAKTLYDYWFVQFDFPDENGKPYRTSGGAMEYNEQLKREIPKGWSIKQASDFTVVVTGKEDANFSTENGQFKFFTCSQDTLLCDSPAFEGHAVLIAGNGDFNVKHYTGKFNAYQRTYVLIPTDSKYYGCLYIASNDKVTAFKSGSNGSIVKFITKGDVEGITIFDISQRVLYDRINTIIEEIEHLDEENEELTRLRDWLLPMLMNGQATVE